MSESVGIATWEAVAVGLVLWFGTLWTLLYFRVKERQASNDVFTKHR